MVKKEKFSRVLATLLFVILAVCGYAQAGQKPTVTTDKLDYEPRSMAKITGHGWYPNAVVVLQIVHTDGRPNLAHHRPFNVSTDANGDFTAEWYVNPIDSLGASFLLTADSEPAGLPKKHAAWRFTDKSATTTAIVSSANPSIYGNSVTFTITVSSAPNTPAPTGDVDITDAGTNIGNVTITPATSTTSTATFVTSSLTGGTHTIRADYNGDGNYRTSNSSNLSQVVNKASSSTAVVSSQNPAITGASVTLTATVTGVAGGATATGTVTFKDGAATLGTGALNGSGVATFATAALTAGSHSITAVYGGNTNYNTSTSSVLTQVINAPVATTTSVISSSNPANESTSVTFTATVTGGATPSGTVTFKDGAATLGTGTLNGSGVATFSTSSLAVGSRSITAVYGGDATHSGSTSSVLSQQIIGNTSIAVTSGTNPSVTGQSVTFTATISTSSGSVSGTVTFKDGATTLGTGTLASNVATFATSALSVGSHSITAVYAGDSNYNGSTSSALTQTVNKGNTTTAVTTSGSPSAPGASVTFTATVSATSPASGTRTGTVTFKDGAATLGTGTLSGNVATFATTSLSIGSHTISAVYAGDTNFNTSTSSNLTQVVDDNSSNITIATSPNPSTFGQAVTISGKVTDSGGSKIGGAPVTIFDNGVQIGTDTANGGGNYSFAISTLSVGTHPITVRYDGNLPTNAPVTSSPVSQVVNKATATVTITNTAQTYNGSPRSVTTSTTPAGLTVNVTYNGSATAPTNAGSYAVVATISDTSYQGTASATLTISKATATLTLSGLAQTFDGTPQGASVTTNPSGMESEVSFTYNGSATVPTNAGSYAVVATLTDTNYTGTASGTLVIAKADQTITFGTLTAKKFGDADVNLSPSASSSLPVTFAASAPASVAGNVMSFPATGGTTVTITVTASQAGDANNNPAPDVTRTFSLKENIAPTSVGSSLPAPNGAGWNTTNVTVSITATDNVGGDGVKQIRYTVDGVLPTLSPGDTTGFVYGVDGIHTITFHAEDNAGNIEADQTLTIKIDQNAPAIFAHPSRPADSNGWYTSPFDISFTAGDGSGSGVDPSTLTAPITYSGPDSKTAFVSADATDFAGNTGHKVFNFKYDSTAPIITVSGLSGSVHESVVFDVSATDSGSGADINLQAQLKKNGVVVWSWSDTDVAPAAPQQSISGAANDGNYHLDVMATDEAGNVSNQSFDFVINNEAPIITFQPSSPEDGGIYNNAQTISYSITSAAGIASTVETLISKIASVDIGPSAISSGTTVSQDGRYTIHLEATDTLGHIAQLDRTFTIDSTPPTLNAAELSGTLAPNPAWYESNVGVTLSADDPDIRTAPTLITGSGVQSVLYYATGAQPIGSAGSPTVVAGSTATFNITVEGTTTITYWAIDEAGNATATDTVTIKYDKTPPTFAAMSNIVTQATLPTGAVVTFTLPTPTDNLDPNPTIVAVPVSGSTFGVGTTTVTLTATDVAGQTFSRTFTVTVGKADQTINFPAIADKTYGDAPFTVSPTSDSGLPVSVVVTSGPASIVGDTVTITGAGSVTLTASQAGDSNYNAATDVSVTFNVDKATPEITLNGGTFTYDGNPHPATGTITGVNGDDLGALAITYNPGGTTEPVNVGTYQAAGNFAGDANYKGVAASAQVHITKGTATLSFGSLTATYDGTPQTVSVTTSPAGLSGVLIQYNGSASAPTAAGSYTVTASLTNANYTATDISGTLVIGKASPTVNVVGGTFPFDGNPHPATGSVTGVGGANLGTPTFTYTPGGASAPVSGGTYAVTGSFAGNANYSSATGTGSITISTTAATLSLSNLSQTYTGAGISATVTTNPGGLSGVTVTYDGSATLPVHPGSYAVVATLSNPNFTASPVNGTLIIGKADATLLVTPVTVNYDGAPHGTTGTATGVQSENLGALTIVYTPGPATPVNAGTYTATGSFAGNADYNAGSATATIQINKASQTITFAGPGNQTFGVAPIALSATSTSGLTVGFSVISGPASLVGNQLTITGAGTVLLQAAQIGNGNYSAAPNVQVTITIAKATPTVVVTGGTFAFDGNPHPATGSVTGVGGANLGTPTFTYTPGGSTAPTSVGTYSVNGSFTGDANYNSASNSSSITITTANATLSLSNLNQSYTGNPISATVTTNPAGLSGVTVTYNGSSTPPTNAGSYAVVASLSNPNFAATPVNGTLVIAKVNATLSVSPVTATFDGAAHGTTGTAIGVKGESLGALTMSYNPGGATAPVNVGSYVATGTYAGNVNYNGGTATANITISKGDQTITFPSPGNKTFGVAPFALNASSTSGLAITYSVTSGPATVSGNTLTITGAGTVVIQAAQAGNANYNAAPNVSVTITINKATPTVLVTGGTFTFDSNPHPATGSVTGVGGASLGTPTFVYTPGGATPPTAVGTYSVTSSYAGSANYNAASGTATITINGTQQATLTLSNLSQTYTGTARLVIVTTNPAGLTGVSVTYNGSTTVPVHAGSYAVVATLTDANYQAAPASGTLVVAKASPTVVVNPVNAVYDAVGHGTTGTATGVQGENLVPVVITYATANGLPPVNIGTYTATGKYTSTTDYLGGTATASITITKRPLTVTADNKTKFVNAANPTLTGVLSGVIPSDGIGGVFSLNGQQALTPGKYTITAGVSDPNGKIQNYAVTLKTGILSVVYKSNSGILLPIKADGTSVFAKGALIPVKFNAFDVNNAPVSYVNTATGLSQIQIISGAGAINSTGVSGTPDTIFRWDGTQWVYNLSTSALVANNTYVYRITLADGTFIDFRFGVK